MRSSCCCSLGKEPGTDHGLDQARSDIVRPAIFRRADEVPARRNFALGQGGYPRSMFRAFAKGITQFFEANHSQRSIEEEAEGSEE